MAGTIISGYVNEQFGDKAQLANSSLDSGSVVETMEYTAGTGLGGGVYVVTDSFVGTPDEVAEITLDNNNVAELKGDKGGVYNVYQFGATGDGSTDDTTALIAAMSFLPVAGAKMSFPNATYIMNTDTDFSLFLDSKTNFIIEGNNSTIKVIDSDPVVANGPVMWVEDCSDGIIQNLTLDGNRANRTPAVTTAHGLHLRNGNSDLIFRNVKVINSVTDGIYIDSTTPGTASTVATDITFENCEAYNCYRNGMSAINTIRLTVSGGSYYGTTGTAPQAGIDLEDNGTAGNVDSIITGARFYDNVGHGLQLSGSVGVTNASVTDCYFKNNTLSAMTVGLCDGLTLSDLAIEEHTGAATRGVVDLISSSTANISIKNVTFHDCNPSGSAKAGLYVHGTIVGPVSIDGVNIYGYNCTGIFVNTDNTTIKNCHIEGASGGTADYPISINGDRNVISNIHIEDSSSLLLVAATAADCVLDGIHMINCTHTAYIWIIPAEVILRNVTILDTLEDKSSGTDKGITFSAAIKELSNINIEATLGQFPADRALNFLVAPGDSAVFSAISPGFWTLNTVGSDVGDAAATLTRGLSETTQVWDTAISADRAVALSTTDAKSGDKFRIVRTASATGGFNLNVGTGPLKAMGTAGSYSDVEYNGSAWILTAYGTL